MNVLSKINPVLLAFFATIFTWLITLLGAAIVFFFKKINKNIMDSMLGFSAGVMIAASFWSLLAPGIEMASNLEMIPWIVAAISFMLGGTIVILGEKIFKFIEKRKKKKSEISKYKRCLMLILSITLHNIPEGLAVGVAFGSIIYGLDGATISSACLLALGIGIQNFPEGCAVSIPLRREGLSRKQAFFFGQLSGFVEPISGVIGALLVLKVRFLLPFLLSFAAGAMIFVAVSELIPESQTNKNKGIITFVTMLGFTIMMILDIALG